MKRIVPLLVMALGVVTAPAAHAQADLGFKNAGVAIGYVSPEDLGGTLGFGVFADLGTMAPRVGLEARLDYWSQSEEAFGTEASVRDITLGARGKYWFETSNPKLRPFAGAGLAFHVVHAEVTIPPSPGFPGMNEEDSATKMGVDVGGGVATDLGPTTQLLGELWYGIVSDVSQLSLRVGVSFKLGS
jgi:opacity protein-like surface antigen